MVSGYVYSRVYELKEGSTDHIADSEKTFKLADFVKGFKLEFIDVFDSSLDSHSKLWISGPLDQNFKGQQNSSYKNWMGYIKLDDMSVKADSSIIKFPIHENFPIDEYMVNKITNEFGSALYITGGRLYSKRDDRYSIGNSFFKYNFTTKEWIDMTYTTNGKLKPMVRHKSLVVDDRFLVILGGSKDEYLVDGYGYNSLYSLIVFDTFTSSWENVNIKPSMFEASVATLEFDDFLATVYSDKVVVLGGRVSGNYTGYIDNAYLGILDFKSKTWAWKLISKVGDEHYYYDMSGSELLVYNNQLIILTGWPQTYPIKVYDMLSHKIKFTLELLDTSNVKDSDRDIPTYAIVLIAVSCTVLLLSFVYFLYSKYNNRKNSKNTKTKSNGAIREVWSDPNIDNRLKITRLDKKKGLAIRNSSSSELHCNIVNSYKSDIIEFSK